MFKYNLLGNELENYYIKAHKIICIICACLVVLLSFFSFFWGYMLVLAGLTMLIGLAFFISYRQNIKKYGDKLSFENGIITIFDYKNRKKIELSLDAMEHCYLNVAFDYGRPRYIYKNCLVLYDNEKIRKYLNLNKKVNYSLYWENNKIIIIQNDAAIEEFNKILK